MKLAERSYPSKEKKERLGLHSHCRGSSPLNNFKIPYYMKFSRQVYFANFEI